MFCRGCSLELAVLQSLPTYPWQVKGNGVGMTACHNGDPHLEEDAMGG